jgi:hypothetical protein
MLIYLKALECLSLDHQVVLGVYILNLHKEYMAQCSDVFGPIFRDTPFFLINYHTNFVLVFFRLCIGEAI